MRLRTVPARHGARWLAQGWRAVLAFPIAFATLFAALGFACLLVRVLPFGSLAMATALPLLALVFMVATRLSLEGTLPTPRAVVLAMRMDRRRALALLQLGIAYVVGMLLVMWVGNLVDNGAFRALIQAVEAGKLTPDEAAASLNVDNLVAGVLLRTGLLFLLATLLWRAPALVLWDGHGAAKALFSSVISGWRNRAAFLVYALTWFATSMLLSFALSFMNALLPPAVFAALSVAALLGFATVFYASLYFAYADCFVSDEVIELEATRPTVL